MGDSQKSESKLKGLSTVSLLTLLSRMTGLCRDALMASLFGTGFILDAFSVAFRMPNMFRRLFGEGAMTAAFLPEFLRVDSTEGREAASALFSGAGWRLLRWLLVLTLLAEFTIAVIYLTCTLSVRSALLCELSMILGPYILLICLGGFYAAALNGVSHFTVPALTPIVLNVVWLSGGVMAANFLASDADEVKAIAVCILLGGVLQLLLLVLKAGRFGIWLKKPDRESYHRAKPIFVAMIPVLIGLSITQVNGIVDSLLAWFLSSATLDRLPELMRFRLPEGTAGALYLGQRLFQFPLGVFAVALGTVLFPRFTRHAQAGDKQQLSNDLVHGLQLVLAVGIPASVGLWQMAHPITELFFHYGAFDDIATAMTSQMIACYGVGVWAFSGLLIINRVYYADGDQLSPMRQGLMCVGFNLLFDLLMLPMLGARALPLASVLATVLQLVIATDVLRSRVVQLPYRPLMSVLVRVIGCSVLMAVAVQLCVSFLPPVDSPMLSRITKVLVPIMAAAVVYGISLTAAGVSPRRLLREPLL